jgi:methionine-rich copper-binding protein CopC
MKLSSLVLLLLAAAAILAAAHSVISAVDPASPSTASSRMELFGRTPRMPS